MNTDSKSGGTAAGSEFVMDLTKVSKKQEETPWLSQAERILLSPLFFYWNTALNEWALSFLDTHDIMAESKGKNLASFALADQAKELNLL